MSEETKRKIGLANSILMKELWKNPEYRKKIIKTHRGYVMPESQKIKIGNSVRGKCKGKIIAEWHKKIISKANKGKTLSKEHREKIRKNNAKYWLGKPSHEQPAWRGGKSFEPYSVDWTETLKRAIRERDRYICRLCGELQGDRAFNVHHIDYNKKNCCPDNLITLCRICHSKTNFGRKEWENYFKEKIYV